MTTSLQPRYARNRLGNRRGSNIFLGYAYDLDVYANYTENNVHSGKYLIVCSIQEAVDKHSVNNPYNWDILSQDKDGNLINDQGDVETTAAHMVEIYNLVAQHKADYTPFVKPENVIRSV